MNNIMKLLTISAISCAVIANSEATNAQAACVKPVQGFVSLGLFGSQSKIKGDVNLKKLQGYTDSAVLKEIGSKYKYINNEEFKKLFDNKFDVKLINPAHQERDTKLYTTQLNGRSNNMEWTRKSGEFIKQSLDTTVDGNVINITQKNDFYGNRNVVPQNSKNESVFSGKNDNDNGGIDGIDLTTSENIAFDSNNNPLSVYDAEHPAPTLTQKITVSIDSSKNPGNLYQVNFNSDDSKNSSDSWTAKGWQLSGYANVGLLVNLPLGGSWYLSFFGMKPFVNSNQNITLGTNNNSSSSDKSEGGFKAKNKGTLGIETGLRCNATDKVWLGIGGGVQRSWYGISLNNSDSNNNSSDKSSSGAQNMKGDAFFAKFSVGFNVTNKIGVETFVKYTAKHDLKTSTSKKKSDSSDSSSTEFPMDFYNPGALSFGVACTFTF